MDTEVLQQFIARLTEIFRQSKTASWQTSLRQVLTLFADFGHAQDAALFLLDDDRVSPYYLGLDSAAASGLCATLQEQQTLWRNDVAQSSRVSIDVPGYDTPVWLWAIPPQSDDPQAIIALSHPDDTSAFDVLDQGSALLAPFFDNVTRECAIEDAHLGNAVIYNQEQRQKYLESLYELIFTINSASDLDEILSTGLNQALQITDLARGCVYMPDKGGTLELHVCRGYASSDMDDVATDKSGFERAVKEKRMVVEHHPPTTTDSEQTDVHLPLIVEDEIVGLVRLNAPEQRDVTPEAAQLLVAIVDQLALAVERGQLTDKMREQLQTVRYLYEISTAFLSQMGSSGIIFLLLRALTDTIAGSLGTIFYQFDKNEWSRRRVYAKHNSDIRTRWMEGPPWDSEREILSTNERKRLITLTSSQPGIAAPFWEHVDAVGGKQLIYFPLFLPNHDFSSAVAVIMDEERLFTANESILAWAIIQQGTAALVRVGLYEQSQRREGLLRAILESSRDGIILVGSEEEASDILYINGQTLQMLALPDDTTVWEGQALSDVVTTARENAPELADWLNDVFEHDSPSEATDKQEKAPDFTTTQGLAVQVQHWPVYAETEQPLGALLMFRDITEEKALQRMRDDLLNMLVHDMRSPLSATQYSLHLLKDPAMQDVSEKIIDIAINGAERLTKLVDTILQIGRLEAGRFELNEQAVILADHVNDATRHLLVSMEALNFEMDIPYNLPFLWVDPNVTTRIFENLLANALKFVPKQDGYVRISATQEGNWIKTEIFNNGPHIPPETQKQLFEKFAAGQYKGRGFGLGLAFCRLAVEAHGGNIWAQNQPDGGVSFYFTLPIWEDPDGEDILM